MSYTMILNACSHTLRAQAQELTAFLQDNGIAPDGRAILLCTDAAPPAADLQAVSAAEVHHLRLAVYQPEVALAALTDVLGDAPPALLLFAGDYAGRELAVRLACRLQGSALVGVCALQREGAQIRCTKPAYASNMEATLSLSRLPACISVAKGRKASSPAPQDATAPRSSAQHDYTHLQPPSTFLSRTHTPAVQTTALANAPFVLAAGRGVKSEADTQRVAQYAAAMGAQFGVSRPLAMQAFAPLDRLIGVSGHMLAPKVCITAGISGAGAFLAGVEHAACLIAINTDASAAIMKAADLAVVGRYEEILEALAALFQKDNAPNRQHPKED